MPPNKTIAKPKGLSLLQFVEFELITDGNKMILIFVLDTKSTAEKT